MKTTPSIPYALHLFVIAALLAVSLAALTPPRAAHAATFTVNTTADTVDATPGDGVCADSGGACSLRAAIREANALYGDDTITLPAGVYLLTRAGAGEDVNATGDLDLRTGITLNGAGAASTIIDANQLDRVFDIRATDDTVVLDGLTITHGRTPNGTGGQCDGGGIFVTGTALTLRNVVVSNNTVGYYTGSSNPNMGCAGGGIYREGSYTVTIEDCTIRDNAAGNGNNYIGGAGGGVYNLANTMIIRRSTLSGNASGKGAGGASDGRGGGACFQSGGVTIENSTLSGNTAGYEDGGGVYVSSSTLTLVHSTITLNTADWGGGVYSTGTANLKNTIVAGNTGSGANRHDCYNAVTSQGYNLVGSGTGCPSSGTGDRTTTDAMLGPLQDNGGPTETHAVSWGSPALEVIPPGTNGCGADYTTDQRGIGRPGGGACEIGAYESPSSYWDGGGADNNTSTAANWSADALPDATDVATFGVASSKDATLDAALHAGGWQMDAAYAGTVSQGSSALTVDGAWTQAGGTFTGGSAALDLAGAFDLSGGTFTAPPGLMTISGGFHHTGGTFTPNGGRVVLDNTTDQSLATTFHDLVVNDGLLGYWKLDEGGGATAYDASGYDHRGTVTNGQWSSEAAATMDFYDPGAFRSDRAGAAEYMLTGDLRKLDAAQRLTLSAWVKLASTPADYMRFITLENEKAVLRYTSGGNLQFYAKIDDTIRSTSVSGVLGPGQWYHVAGTYDGSALRVYLDGAERNSNAVAGTVATGNWVRLSHSANDAALDGLLDDVRVYDRALTATEISDLAAGKHPSTSVATTTLGAALDVNGDLTLNSGTLDVSAGNYAITLAGDFTRNGGVFTPRSGTVAIAGAAPQTLDTDAITFNHLTVNPDGTLVTRKNFTASGTLTNNGVLQQTKPFVAGGTAWFFTGGYQGVQMLAPTGTALGDTTVTIQGNQDCTTTPDTPVRRCWNLAAATPGQPVGVQLHFTAGELAGNACDTLYAYRWNGSAWEPQALDTSWSGDGRACESAPYSVRIKDVIAFGSFVLKSPSQPKAVMGLQASADDGALRLDWTAVTRDLDDYGLPDVTYNVYRGVDNPYFAPGAAYATGLTTTWWADPEDVLAATAHNYTYLVRAVANGLAAGDSYRVGAFAFGLTPGTTQ